MSTPCGDEFLCHFQSTPWVIQIVNPMGVDTGAQNFDNIQPDPRGGDTVSEPESAAVSDVQEEFPAVDTGAQNFDNIQPDPRGQSVICSQIREVST